MAKTHVSSFPTTATNTSLATPTGRAIPEASASILTVVLTAHCAWRSASDVHPARQMGARKAASPSVRHGRAQVLRNGLAATPPHVCREKCDKCSYRLPLSCWDGRGDRGGGEGLSPGQVARALSRSGIFPPCTV